MTGSMTQHLWRTYKPLVHATLDLEDPVDEIFLLVLEAASVLGVLDSAEDANHACGCPTIAYASTEYNEDQWTGERMT